MKKYRKSLWNHILLKASVSMIVLFYNPQNSYFSLCSLDSLISTFRAYLLYFFQQEKIGILIKPKGAKHAETLPTTKIYFKLLLFLSLHGSINTKEMQFFTFPLEDLSKCMISFYSGHIASFIYGYIHAMFKSFQVTSRSIAFANQDV